MESTPGSPSSVRSAIQLLHHKWLSDITYIATGEGWLYLAAIMDLASRSIVRWATSANIDTALVKEALDRAVANRKPPVGLILHSDRRRSIGENTGRVTKRGWTSSGI